jgi:hypothetical protein
MTEDEKLELLKEILLTEEREFDKTIAEKLKNLDINQKVKLPERVDPIIEGRLDEFIKEMPETLGPTITETLSEQIKNSKDAVVEALYPIMGKMIKRYIQNEMKVLTEKINAQMKNNFSSEAFKRKFKSIFSGVSEEELILSELSKPEIQQIFIIEKDSGLLSASFTKKETIDEDMISGMLTAIKSFVEDAFNAGKQNLESIEYETYNIHVQNFHFYYIAVIISGAYNNTYKNMLENKLLDFSEHIMKNHITEENISAELEKHFKDE